MSRKEILGQYGVHYYEERPEARDLFAKGAAIQNGKTKLIWGSDGMRRLYRVDSNSPGGHAEE